MPSMYPYSHEVPLLSTFSPIFVFLISMLLPLPVKIQLTKDTFRNFICKLKLKYKWTLVLKPNNHNVGCQMLDYYGFYTITKTQIVLLKFIRHK